MPLFRYFRESAASGRGEVGVAVIAGKWIDANVRLRLTANRTYGPSFNNHRSEYQGTDELPFGWPRAGQTSEPRIWK